MATYRRVLNDREIENIKRQIDACECLKANMIAELEMLVSLNLSLDKQKTFNIQKQDELLRDIDKNNELIKSLKENIQ